jgi:hypothetical protein
MPPGKGFYYKEKRAPRSVTPLYLLAGVPILALFAWVGMCSFGGGGSTEVPAEGQTQKQVKPTELPKVAPTRDPATKHGGANEGAASIPNNPEKPDIKEYLIAGGRRFDLPLSVHAGVEEYFGTSRADGKVHAGVDFSLLGLKNVPVESACDGFVSEASTDEIYGTHVIVDCGANFKVVIGWLETVRVAKGNNVSQSTVVGIGEQDGFVHIELRYKDVPLDPKDFMQIPGKEVIPWTPTPSPTPRPDDTATPEPTPTNQPGSTPVPGGPTNTPPPPGETAVPTDTPTPGPPTSTPTITPTPTRTPTPTKTPVPPKNTPTPLPRSY